MTLKIHQQTLTSRSPAFRAGLLLLLGIMICLGRVEPLPGQPPAEEPVPDSAESLPPQAALNARAQALLLAKAFEQERFVLRDRTWEMTLRPRENRVLRLNLLQGLTYWFCAGTTSDAAPQIYLYDEQGQPLPPRVISQSAGAAGVMLEPDYTGSYYIKITNPGAETAAVCLMYCYK